MSVLLEALKKAAEEKKKKESSLESSETSLKKTQEDASKTSHKILSENVSANTSLSNTPFSENSLGLKLSPVEPEKSKIFDLVSEASDIYESAKLTAPSNLQILSDRDLSIDDDFSQIRKAIDVNPQSIALSAKESFVSNDGPSSFDEVSATSLKKLSDFQLVTISQDKRMLDDEKPSLSEKIDFDDELLATDITSLDEKLSPLPNFEAVDSGGSNPSAGNPKDIDESYSWSMDQLPGYDNPPLIDEGYGSSLNQEISKKTWREKLSKNPVLTKGMNRKPFVANANKFTPRVVYFSVFLVLFLGLFFALALFYQQESEALERSFIKYKIARVDVSKEVLAMNQKITPLESPEQESPEQESDKVPLPGSQQKADVDEKSLLPKETPIASTIGGDLQSKMVSAINEAPIEPSSETKQFPKPSSKVIEASEKEVIVDKKQGLSESQTQLQEGYRAFQQKDWMAAEAAFNSVLEFDSRNVNALIGMAGVLVNKNKFTDSLSFYQKALQVSPKNRFAVEGVASILQRFPIQAVDWLPEIETLLLDYPDSAILQNAVGSIYVFEQKWQQAQEHFFEALKAQPQNSVFNLNMAISLDHLKQYPLAIDYYTKALVYKNSQSNFDENAIKQRLAALKLYDERNQ